jgi:predicted DNA-binding protein
MLGIRLEPELEEKLESLAKETGRSKSYYAAKPFANISKIAKIILKA